MAKERNSNIELYRIILMLAIVAHHYVVGTGGQIVFDGENWKRDFILIFGAWGKIGINCFTLITGYYMCKSQITAKKFIKLFLEVLFYNILFFTLFVVFGYEKLSIHSLTNCLPVSSIKQNYTGCFLMLYLAIPFINILIRALNKKQYRNLLMLLGFVYVFFGTFRTSVLGVSMNYFSWLIVVYLIGAYLRINPLNISTKNWTLLAITTTVLSTTSIYISDRLISRPYAFVMDSNTILAVFTSVCLFMVFVNIKIPNSTIVNTIASTTFGILQIHANSETMRRWLWGDIFNLSDVYHKSLMPLRMIGTVVVVFMICSGIDLIRQIFMEKPFINLIEKCISKQET